MGTFFKEQKHLKEPFQTFKSLTPIQLTKRTVRMKYLLPILILSLAVLVTCQPEPRRHHRHHHVRHHHRRGKRDVEPTAVEDLESGAGEAVEYPSEAVAMTDVEDVGEEVEAKSLDEGFLRRGRRRCRRGRRGRRVHRGRKGRH